MCNWTWNIIIIVEKGVCDWTGSWLLKFIDRDDRGNFSCLVVCEKEHLLANLIAIHPFWLLCLHDKQKKQEEERESGWWWCRRKKASQMWKTISFSFSLLFLVVVLCWSEKISRKIVNNFCHCLEAPMRRRGSQSLLLQRQREKLFKVGSKARLNEKCS